MKALRRAFLGLAGCLAGLGCLLCSACDPLDDEGSDYERHPPADAGQGSHGAWGDGDEITGTFGEKG